MEPKNTDENKTKTRRKRSDGDGGEERPRGSGNLIYLLLFFVGAIAIIAGFQQYYGRVKVITSFFEKQLVGKEYNGKPILDEDGNPIKCNIESITFKEFRAEGTFRVLPLKELTESEVKKLDGDHPKLARKSFWVGLDPAGNGKDREKFQDILKKAGVAYDVDSEPSNAFPYLLTFIMLLPVVLLLYFWYASRRAQDSMLGGGGFMSSFSRSPAQRNVEDSNKIVFSDVAGLEGVKADLQEIVEYLREPEKFQRLGGQVPNWRPCSMDRRVPEKLCWHERLRVKLMCRFIPSMVANLFKCLSELAPVVCVTFSNRRRKHRLRLFLSMKLTQSDVSVVLD